MQKLLLVFVCLSFGCVVVIRAADCEFNTTALEIIPVLPLLDIYTIFLLDADQYDCLITNGFTNSTVNVTVSTNTGDTNYPAVDLEIRGPTLLEIVTYILAGLGLAPPVAVVSEVLLSGPSTLTFPVDNDIVYPIKFEWDQPGSGDGYLHIIV